IVQAADEAERLLNDAVRIRLRSDVPIGCFLSGGIDSGLLTSIASRELSQPLKTFTVAFPDTQFDETALALKVAVQCHTDHRVLLEALNLVSDVPQILAAFDQPFADPSAIPTYAVAKVARRHVTVALSGEGADEVFAGYRKFQAARIAGAFAKICPASLARGL